MTRPDALPEVTEVARKVYDMLDTMARDRDSYDFGLPMFNRGPLLDAVAELVATHVQAAVREAVIGIVAGVRTMALHTSEYDMARSDGMEQVQREIMQRYGVTADDLQFPPEASSDE